MRGVVLAGLAGALMLIGCGDPGPSPEELAKARADKDCGKLYSSLTKVLQDELRKGGVSGVEFGEKPGFVSLCAEQGLSEAQLKCLDPNLGGTEECKKELEPVAEKTKKLTEYLLAPMKKKQEEKGGKAKAKAE